MVLKSFLSGLWAAFLYLGLSGSLYVWREPGKPAWLLSVASSDLAPEVSVFAGPATWAMPPSSPLAHVAVTGIREGFCLCDLSVVNGDLLPMVLLVRHEQKALIIPLSKCWWITRCVFGSSHSWYGQEGHASHDSGCIKAGEAPGARWTVLVLLDLISFLAGVAVYYDFF